MLIRVCFITFSLCYGLSGRNHVAVCGATASDTVESTIVQPTWIIPFTAITSEAAGDGTADKSNALFTPSGAGVMVPAVEMSWLKAGPRLLSG
jgi:hypothetical protein